MHSLRVLLGVFGLFFMFLTELPVFILSFCSVFQIQYRPYGESHDY